MKEGKLVRGEHAKDGVVTMEDEQYKTNIGVSKVAAGGGEELPGAELKVENAEGVLIDIWQSNGSTHVITDLVDGTYTLTEDQAPLGYLKAESITFEIKEGKLIESANAKDGVVTITDSRTKVTVSKQNIAGEEIEGAQIQIKDKDGNIVEEWTSGDDGKDENGKIKPHVIEGKLNVDEEYTLHEEAGRRRDRRREDPDQG